MLAHVPDLNDFVGGMKVLLKPGGVITMEFPHLHAADRRATSGTRSTTSTSRTSRSRRSSRVFAAHGLRLFDVEELPTHGGSLRIFGCHADDAAQAADRARRASCWSASDAAGYDALETYLALRRSA